MRPLLAIILLSAVPACFFPEDNHSDPPSNGGGGGGNNGGNNGGGGGGGGEEERGSLPLEFSGVQPLNGSFPNQVNINNHIAVGGTHQVTLKLDSDFTDLEVPYEAGTLQPDVLTVESIEGPLVTLRARATGLDDLMISDPDSGELFDDALYAMSAFSRAVGISAEEVMTTPQYDVPAQNYVFATGRRRVAIAYLNAYNPPNRLVDTSATLSSAGAMQTRWDEVTFDAATPGMHSIAVTVGGVETTIEVEVVSTADTVETMVSFAGIACFGAFAHDAFVSGGAWTYKLDGATFVSDPQLTAIFGPNCVFFDSTATHTVVATAFGKSVSVTVPGQTP